MLGFRGPLGAFIAAWGGITMLTSAPFDDWWHNAYGLDVKILSPPHVVLAIGIGAIHVGALIFVLGRMNRVEGRARRVLTLAFLFIGAMLMVALLTLFMEHTCAPTCTALRSTGRRGGRAPDPGGGGARLGTSLGRDAGGRVLLAVPAGDAVADAAGAGAAQAGAGDDPGDQPDPARVPAVC